MPRSINLDIPIITVMLFGPTIQSSMIIITLPEESINLRLQPLFQNLTGPIDLHFPIEVLRTIRARMLECDPMEDVG